MELDYIILEYLALSKPTLGLKGTTTTLFQISLVKVDRTEDDSRSEKS